MEKEITPTINHQSNTAVPAGFERVDRWLILVLALILMISAAGYFGVVRWLGLTNMPLLPTNTWEDYFGQANHLREQRLRLAITSRTFLAAMGYVVGLVIASFGALFVLRRAFMRMKISGSAEGTGKGFLSLDSQGVVFMFGGVGVIIASQMLVQPITTSEVFPDTGRLAVTGDGQSAAPQQLQAFCERSPTHEGCVAMTELLKNLEGGS